MKILKLISGNFLLIILIATLSSCEKWNWKGIHGEGTIVSQDFKAPAVEGIILEIPATVYLAQGDEQSISIEAQQNILDNMIISNKNDILKISFDKDVSNSEPIKVYMTIQNLRQIDLLGSGEIVSDSKFNSNDKLSINISGSGYVDVEADAKEIDLYIAGSGEIKLKTVCELLHGNISGSGDIKLDGSAPHAEFNTSGSGEYYAYKFVLETCKVSTIGSGDAEVNVSDNLTVNITGSGDVYYLGHPVLSVNITGSGSLINAN